MGSKKHPDTAECFLQVSTMSKLSLGELILTNSAERTLKIIGKILELSAGSYAALGTALLLIIFPTANVTNVFHK